MSNSKDDDLWEDQYSGKTQWEDALIKHGVAKPGEVQKTFDDVWTAHLERTNEAKRRNPHKDLLEASDDKFDASRDVIDEKDFETIRKKRLAELKAKAAKNKFGTLYEISETDWIKEINEEDPSVIVVVHLMAKSKTECIHFNRTLATIASRFKYIKCVSIEGFKAAKGFPDELCPTVIIYQGGRQLKQIQGFDSLGGAKNSVEKFEYLLAAERWIDSDLVDVPGDVPTRKTDAEEEIDKEQVHKALRAARSKVVAEDDDDSWLQDD